ncbi:MAG: 3-isopropylmalate dehydrogenase [Cellvibrionales bacterium]|nr:3-isopropylmalate dehydrogenase [Cellvibrionales bacterium]
MSARVLIIPGDGIGAEIVAAAQRVLEAVAALDGLELDFQHALLGGAALDAHGDPYPPATRAAAREADAILFGAVGGPRWEQTAVELRPEAGLLALRADLDLFANLRPAQVFAPLADSSSLKPDLVAGLDILLVRELTGGIYFGEPRGIRTRPDGEREGVNTEIYRESEIRRIAQVAFAAAGERGGRLCSVDKANVLEVSRLWRAVVDELAADYPQVELGHLYVDNAAMQLAAAPKQFDVLLTPNLFGDILSDLAAVLTGSIGMLPSASLDGRGGGLYEPVHGSAPDLAGQNVANPLATILSAAMLLRHSLNAPDSAARIEAAVARVLEQGLRTADIATAGQVAVGTAEMGDAVVAALAS